MYNVISKYSVTIAIILLIYALYGKLNGILALGYPSYGYNFAFQGFIILFLCIWFTCGTINTPLNKALLIFTITGSFSCLFNFYTTESFINNELCVLAPISAYGIGLYVSKCEASNNRKPLYLLLLGFSFLEILCIISLIKDKNSLMLNRDFVFCIVFLTPIVALIKNKLIGIVLFLIDLIIIFLSIKRSAIIGIVASSLIMCIISLLFNKSISLLKKLSIIITIIPIIGGVTYLYVSAETMDKVLTRMEEMTSDGGSGRDQIYETIINKIGQSDIPEKVLGHGYNAISENLFKHPAHNDLLEISYDYGLLTLTTWVLFILAAFNQSIRAVKRRKYYYGGLLLSSLVLWQSISETNCIFPNEVYTASMFIIFGIISYKINNGKTAVPKSSNTLREI